MCCINTRVCSVNKAVVQVIRLILQKNFHSFSFMCTFPHYFSFSNILALVDLCVFHPTNWYQELHALGMRACVLAVQL